MDHVSKHAALFLMGFFAIAAQILLIRELLISFSGNELSIGIFLANWLLLEAAGSFSAAHLAKRIKSAVAGFSAFQLLLAGIFPLTVYFARTIKSWSALLPSEMASLPLILISSFLLLAPVALINGAQFTMGCRLGEGGSKGQAQTIGKVYIIESLGSIAAGFLVTFFFLQHLDNFQAAFLLSVLNNFSALFLLAGRKKHDKPPFSHTILRGLHVVGALIFLYLITPRATAAIEQRSAGRQWPAYRLLTSRNSVYGNTTLLERDGQFDLLSNGVPFLTLPLPDLADIEDKVHLPLLFHPDPRLVFLVGGGPGGMLTELLKHPVERIDYAEMDPTLISTLQKNLPDTMTGGLGDRRVHIHYQDGRHYLQNCKRSYDIILLNLPQPSTLEINRFFTEEFYRMCHSHLRKNGILVFTLPGSAAYLNESLARLNDCLSKTVSHIFKFQHVFPFQTSLYLVSDEAYINELPGKEISKRLLQRNIQTRVINPAYISYKFDILRESAFHSEIRQYQSSTLNSDMQPYAVYLDLLYLNEPLAPGFSSVYSWFRHLKQSELLLLILLIFILVFFYKRYKKSEKQMPVHLVLFSSGFAGMATSLIMILFFQALFGYVYLWIGMIISGFMVGIAAGSFIYIKDLVPGERPDRLLLLSETAHILFFLLLVGGLGFLRTSPNNPWFHLSAPYLIIVLSIISGLLTGYQFPLANRLYLAGNPSILYSAGTLYAADLAGAWLAGILVTLLMIPVLGLVNTAIILLCLKACTACLVWLGLAPGTSANGYTTSATSTGRHREPA